MDSYTSNVLAVMIALLGLIGFLALDGMGGGISIFAAGLLLVALGVWGWKDRRRRPAAAMAGEAGGTLQADREMDVEVRPASEDPALDPVVGESEAVGDLLGTGMPEAGDPTATPAAKEGGPVVGGPSIVLDDDAAPGHRHEHPILGHGDLVAHVRDYHEGTAHDGSTIQLRLLHERDHGGEA